MSERRRGGEAARMFRSPRLTPIDVIEELAQSGALAIPVLEPEYRRLLLETARASRFRAARPLVGKGDRIVSQRMEVCEHFPAGSTFRVFTREFQKFWDEFLSDAPPGTFDGQLVFNDLMLQRYSVGEVGITPHRDRTGYRNLVCLFVLEGKGRFYVCDDRAGNGAREIPHAAGDLLLMRAPGFQASPERPFHFVRDIQSPRYVFGLRQEGA